PAARSLEDAEITLDGGVSDYRGQEVWFSTEYLPETGWGVLVKVDAWEQELPQRAIRTQLLNIMIILAAFAIVAGAIIGYRVAQPIHLLSEAANRIREGDLSARTGIKREDEVGLLAQTFDSMGAELEEQVKLLTEYQMFFDWSLDMMCIAATDGYFKRVNAAWTRELGWTQEELLSRPFVSFVHPEDVDKTIAEVAKLDQGIPTIHFENRYLAKDGTYKTLRWRSSPEQGTGRLYAIARVITPGAPDEEVAPTFPEEGPLPTPATRDGFSPASPGDEAAEEDDPSHEGGSS
ncbi:MAG: HAMP domain-containing protein, partial [Longimicrobiales bacterium]|nr:HAMP domain-containing protein [Longimicrobiales bacterium]